MSQQNDPNAITSIALNKSLQETLAHMGFQHFTDIQAQAIPVALAGHDVLASSKTGSGKTLAYLLPTLHRLSKQKAFSRQDPRAIILAPTRELAKQVYAQVRSFTANTPFKVTKLLGGENFNDQYQQLKRRPHIIVATPGRLADHLQHRHLFVEGLEVLILDEADRMLDLGFEKALRDIHAQAKHRKRQTLLFSATLEHAVAHQFAADLLNQPKRIAIGADNQLHTDIQQHFYFADHIEHKDTLLTELLAAEMAAKRINQLIVFTATREDTERLAEKLSSDSLSCQALSGKMTQVARNRIMDQFARGQFNVLLTTDVASRGLDIANVSHVINFDLPKHAEEYVHRIGRTGRAGAKGQAYSFVGPKDWQSFKAIKAFLSQDIEFDVIDGFEATFKGFKDKPKTAARRGKGPARGNGPDKPIKRNTKPKKRDKSFFTGVDGGFEPMRRKKPQPPEATDTDVSSDDNIDS